MPSHFSTLLLLLSLALLPLVSAAPTFSNNYCKRTFDWEHKPCVPCKRTWGGGHDPDCVPSVPQTSSVPCEPVKYYSCPAAPKGSTGVTISVQQGSKFAIGPYSGGEIVCLYKEIKHTFPFISAGVCVYSQFGDRLTGFRASSLLSFSINSNYGCPTLEHKCKAGTGPKKRTLSAEQKVIFKNQARTPRQIAHDPSPRAIPASGGRNRVLRNRLPISDRLS